MVQLTLIFSQPVDAHPVDIFLAPFLNILIIFFQAIYFDHILFPLPDPLYLPIHTTLYAFSKTTHNPNKPPPPNKKEKKRNPTKPESPQS